MCKSIVGPKEYPNYVAVEGYNQKWSSTTEGMKIFNFECSLLAQYAAKF